jgi:hypothetical protein
MRGGRVWVRFHPVGPSQEHPKLTGRHGDGTARHADGLGLEPNWLPFSRGEGIWGRTSKSNGVVVRIPKYLIRCPNA